MDLTGVTNRNEYYTNHYLSAIFEENASEVLKRWRSEAQESSERTPWSRLRACARLFNALRSRGARTREERCEFANAVLTALGYAPGDARTAELPDAEQTVVPVYREYCRASGTPQIWALLVADDSEDADILESAVVDGRAPEDAGVESPSCDAEELATRIFFELTEPPRFLLLIGTSQIALLDRRKWNEKRYLQFELDEIFGRNEESTFQAVAVLLHYESLAPKEGTPLLDELDANSQKHAAGVSEDLKYALRESVELLGNEVLYDLATRGKSPSEVDAGELTLECLRYMYRMLFVLFIESRPELGYAPILNPAYARGYSLDALRDVASAARENVDEVANGYFIQESLSKLFDLIYNGYPGSEEDVLAYSKEESLRDMFVIAPLKAHVFDPERTPTISQARLRNKVMLRIIDLMSVTRASGKKNERRGRISYANLGINQLGSVYEALLSYRGFIAQETLYEVKRAGDKFNELDVGYFVPERELAQYSEEERVRYEEDDPQGAYRKGALRRYEPGTFIYRMAGREREKSASYYTPEVLTKCLVHHALEELLKDKTADEILNLTICEPAMGSAAFLNEAVNQLAEAYLERKQRETGESIDAKDRRRELQKVKMYIADRNVYGIDLNPVAVELAEVSLWLNTIYEGGFVPWFGTQLVNGNSLIGARRQVYKEDDLVTMKKESRWHTKAPERLPFDKKRSKKQIYHFLLGDPGMCAYSDKAIKALEPEKIKTMAAWNKKFTERYAEEDLATLESLSAVIDKLWRKQIELRREIEEKTRDRLSVYGRPDAEREFQTTIRQKDEIFSRLYKSEDMLNAGPYARLKFAMDYWCALWFWPIEHVDLLPSRSEFLFDMSLILEGTATTDAVNKNAGQPLLFGLTPKQEMAFQIREQFADEGVVDIPKLRSQFKRLDIAAQIAERNHFMHWELEFADVFDSRGGFDLIIGNPPWVKIEWNEQGVLSERYPFFVIHNLSATETVERRIEALQDAYLNNSYFTEYESLSGEQSFLNAEQNYLELKGQQTNLYKCFLPQAWSFSGKKGVSAYIHPDGVYDDSKGGALREILFERVRKHFMFANERKLFREVHHHTTFSLNVYGGPQTPSFDSVSNLYDPNTIQQCYDGDASLPVPGFKDENGNWNLNGHPHRIIHITKKELTFFARLLEDSTNWKQAKLPVLHTNEILDVLELFANQQRKLSHIKDVLLTEFWHETNDQTLGFISADKEGNHIKTSFAQNISDSIYSAPNMNMMNSYATTTSRLYKVNSDYERVDLTAIPEDYLIRCRYRPGLPKKEYEKGIPSVPWGGKVTDYYRIMSREFVGCDSERTLTCAIAPRAIAHVNAVFSACIKNCMDMACLAGCEASLPYDFFVRCLGKRHINKGTYLLFPFFDGESKLPIVARTLLMNCLTVYYRDLWNECWRDAYKAESWSKEDPRLNSKRFTSLTNEWTWATPLRTDYERRQALVELDVLTSMALGMTLEQLKTIYRIQFRVLQDYEADTWYDANGRIVFTNNRSLTDVGYKRPEWEQIKNAQPGERFYRTITDDTLPGGPVERTIEYVAPFDRCDREQDYETAWRFFEARGLGGTKG
ncbi:MAG: N-6 DNA methylase [Thermoguttaceae bacterium]|nr:N-6 DNA methylase [Thermoguttaceae bacterium]